MYVCKEREREKEKWANFGSTHTLQDKTEKKKEEAHYCMETLNTLTHRDKTSCVIKVDVCHNLAAQ